MTRNVFVSLRNGTLGFVMAAMVMAAPMTISAQDTGTIVGIVTDGQSNRPLGSVQVYIDGTGLGVLSNSSGRFVILSVPAGTHSVVAEIVGYRSQSETVTVSAGQTAQVNIAVTQTAITLDEIVITGTGVAIEKKKLGNSIATVDVSRLENTPITSFSDIIQGRTAGVVGLPGGGDTGAGGRIRIRGSASLSQSNEPIVYVDGIRIDNSAGGAIAAGQARTSRLDDIDPNSIERIEILKGAAAATLYGTEASNGVIQIFTKKGKQGPAQWVLQTDQAAIVQNTERFIDHASWARNAEDVARMNSRWGINTQPYEVFQRDILSEMWDTGRGQAYSGSVSGGGDLITYFASGRYSKDDGPFGLTDLIDANDANRKRQGTLNMNIFPFDNLRLRISGLYSEVNQEVIPGGNNIFGVWSSALMSKLHLASPSNLYGQKAFATLRENGQVTAGDDIEHFAGSMNANWTIAEGVVFDGTFGVDVTNMRSVHNRPFGWDVDGFTGSNTEGSRVATARNNREVTGDFKLSWTTDFSENFSSTFLAGAQGFLGQTVVNGGNAQRFPGPGLEVISAGADQSVTETWLREVNVGGYVQEQLGYQDWLFTTVGARWDANSAFGEDFDAAFYPKASVSIIPTDLFDWENETLSTFRVRAAWGTSGLQPGAFDKFTTFSPLPSATGPGLQPRNLGNQALKPETSTEWEVGTEFGLWNDRVGVDFTYWDRTTSDALVARQFAVTGGFTRTQLDNIGELVASGLELTVNGSVFNRETSSLNVFANAAYITEEVTDMGGAPPLKTGGSYPRYRNFIKEGYAPGTFFGAVLNRDMAIPLDVSPVACQEPTRQEALEFFSAPIDPGSFEVIPVGCAGGAVEYLDQFIGKPTPDWSGSFGFDLSFLSNFSLSTSIEYKVGNYMVQDLTGAFRQANSTIGRNTPEAARVESTLLNPASTAEQRLDAALEWASDIRALAPMSGMNQIWSADFLRWRELSLSYRLPSDLTDRLNIGSATVTAGGRNLKIFMLGDYRGMDPEINPQSACSGGGTNCNFLVGTEAFGMPIPSRFTFAVRIGF